MAVVVIELDRQTRRSAVSEERETGRNDSAILAAGLQAELDKFSVAPLVLADDPEVRALLGNGQSDQNHLNMRLEALANQTKAAAIYLIDADGLTLAASNWRQPTSFVGSNYRFRRYFAEALRSGKASQFALGTVSRKPGLYIAQSVRDGDRVVGVVALKVEFDRLEASWRETTSGVFVTDDDGVILITSNEAWRFRTTRPDLAVSRNGAFDQRQFGIDRLETFDIARDFGSKSVASRPVDAEQPIPSLGWHLHLLVDPSERIAAEVAGLRFYLLLIAGGLIGILIAAYLLHNRREKRAKRVLADRTHALREQLGQANRLALLGQITAGVGHEINQPVAAARVYAENGLQQLDRGQIDDARNNFGKIASITEKIGTITAELRNFSRRGSAEAQPMPVVQPIDGALLLLHDRIARTGTIVIHPNEEELATVVRSEPVQLEQVLVNLLQNALDANPQGGSVELALSTDAEFCYLAVQDVGPGLGAIGERIFQPFATTKMNGLGLGLVISRDIMRDLGGDLTVAPSVHGARFVMRIPRG